MIKLLFTKINLIKILCLFNLLKIIHFQEQDPNKFTKLILEAEKSGVDLTNPNDEFFLDICIGYYYNKKDVTLDYRRKYFFFPNKKDKLVNFSYPKRNNTNSCFFLAFQINYCFSNIIYDFLFPLFLFQISMMSIVMILNIDQLFKNTPIKKIELLKNFKCRFFNEKKNETANFSNFSEFIPELTNFEESNTKQNYNHDRNETEQNMVEESVNKMNVDVIKDTNKKELSTNSSNSKNYLTKVIQYSIGSTTDITNPKSNIPHSNCTAKFNNNMIEDEQNENNKNNEKEDIKNVKINENENLSEAEDDYSFGMNNQYQINDNKVNIDIKKSNSKINELDVLKKEEKIKNTQIIYNSLNKDKSQNNNNNKSNYIPTYLNQIKKEKSSKIIYVREEYFYFGYLLARIEDKRSIINIYYDLLEQCQFIFKFFFSPFNIYEDSKVQLVYYAIKINLYFYFNCILINNNVINNIYDDKNFLIDDIFRSLIACIYTYFISLFIYKISNIKKTLIARRYRLLNIEQLEQRINYVFQKMTYKMAMDNLYTKLIIFIFVMVFIFIYSFYVCYGFCSVYYYTKFYLLKGVFISIIISLISPFIFCWIPSYFRKKALSEKKEKLFKIAKGIEFFFVA